VADEGDLRLAGSVFLRHGNLQRGAAGLEAWLNAGRGTPAERAAVRLELAAAFLKSGNTAEAERRALRAVADPAVPAPQRASGLVLAGRAQLRDNRTQMGRATLRRATAEHPDERPVAEAHFILADQDHDAGRIDDARRHYAEAMRLDPGGANGGLAAMRLAGLAWMEADHLGAARLLEGYRGAAAGERLQQASYWAGRAWQAAGDTARAATRLREAHEMDPATFYGAEALAWLGAEPWQLALSASPPADAELAQAARGALARQSALRAAGLEEAATYEAGRMRRYLATVPGGLYALAETHHARGETFAGISIGREIHRGTPSWNARLLRIVYPFPWRSAVEAEAARAGVDPYLVAGLIRQESMFDPRAVSAAGAVGLMQVMPATARALGPAMGIERAEERLRDPEVNLRLGIRVLTDHLHRYDGRVDELLVAYNAGSGRLARWRQHPEYAFRDLFAERIPYPETRDYVRTVRQNARIYLALYGTPAEAASTPRSAAPAVSAER
ncbi:MAG: lytic transglycosylase domain-containing protein, partial [Gemmatimonadota bacterium]